MAADRYLEPHQARERAPTLMEDLLGDSIERAFGEGVQTLPELVAYLNRSGPSGEPPASPRSRKDSPQGRGRSRVNLHPRDGEDGSPGL